MFFGGTLWWIGYVTLTGAAALTLYLALYFGVWSWLAQQILVKGRGSRVKGKTGESSFTLHPSPLTALFMLPASWVALEYLRGRLLTGFGWNLLAHTQWNWISVIQLADGTGVWGVSFLVVLVNAALYWVVKGQGLKVKGKALSTAILCLAAVLAYGGVRLKQISSPGTLHRSPFFKVAVLQGNVPQPEKWDEAFAEAIWKRYESLVAEAAKEKPDLILWPETAAPGFLEDPGIAERLAPLARRAGSAMLVGVPTENEEKLLFNTAVLIGPEGAPVERHDKIHLVPFGEYIPLKPLFGWLENRVVIGDFSPGRRFTVFHPSPSTLHPVAPFSVLICFEDLFPELPRRFVKEGARWLVVITNDAWFKRSAACLQHLQASVFRAVENRVWIARAANTGWSGFVDPAGRRLAIPRQVPRFEPGIAVTSMTGGPAAAAEGGRTRALWPAGSLYTRWGDWFPWGCFFLVGLGIMKKGARLKPGT